MTFSQAWTKSKDPELAKTKLMDIKMQRQIGLTMVAESELTEKSQVQSFQVHEVKMPFKSAKMEAKPARNLVRAVFFRASTTEEYPWNKTPIVVTHLHAKHTYVIPRKTKKQQLNKTRELVCWCPALRLQKTLPSKTRKIGARVDNNKTKSA